MPITGEKVTGTHFGYGFLYLCPLSHCPNGGICLNLPADSGTLQLEMVSIVLSRSHMDNVAEAPSKAWINTQQAAAA